MNALRFFPASLLFLLFVVGCDLVPNVGGVAEGEDPSIAIRAMGWSIRVSSRLPEHAVTDCVTQTVWVKPEFESEFFRRATLAHEYVHVLQADALGCSQFLVRYAAAPDDFEDAAYVAEWAFNGCHEKGKLWNYYSEEVDPSLLDPGLCD